MYIHLTNLIFPKVWWHQDTLLIIGHGIRIHYLLLGHDALWSLYNVFCCNSHKCLFWVKTMHFFPGYSFTISYCYFQLSQTILICRFVKSGMYSIEILSWILIFCWASNMKYNTFLWGWAGQWEAVHMWPHHHKVK